MGRMANIEPFVAWILGEYPETRDSDSLLYERACEIINPKVKFMNFSYVMQNRSKLGLPCMESIRRARQKLQAKNEDLRANSKTIEARLKLEQEYKAYALE